MAEFSVEAFHKLLADVLRKRNFIFRQDMSAKDVPGWDSMNHIFIIMEINKVTGLDLSPEDTAKLPSLGALHDAILEAQRSHG
jgi:acyl carrier protein